MADIAGIGAAGAGFGFNPTRSTPGAPEEQLQRLRADEINAPRPTDRASDVAPAETDAPDQTAEAADQQPSPNRTQELSEDTVSLSAGAEQALAAEPGAGAPADIAATPAAGAVNSVAADLRATNQDARQEDTTTEVNGNQNSQSEGTRTLGQVVDQFA